MSDETPDKHPPAIMTVKEAAQYCRLSKPTLDRYRVSGEGPRFAKFGQGKGAVRYRKQDLDDWIASRIVRSTSEGVDNG